MSNKTRKWLRGMIETIVHGGASAVVASISAANIAPADFSLGTNPQNFFKMAVFAFLVNGGLRFFQYWANHPLPDEETTPSSPVIETPKISLSPLEKVVSVPKE